MPIFSFSLNELAKQLHFRENSRENYQILNALAQKNSNVCKKNRKYFAKICHTVICHQNISTKMVPLFHLLLTSFAFFLRNLRKSKLFIVFP